jgi:hypothetical protein
MNEEQLYWADQMHIRFSAFHTSLQNLKFLEDRLGKVNIIVIDFRKHIEMYHKQFTESQKEFEKCGGIDYCLSKI